MNASFRLGRFLLRQMDQQLIRSAMVVAIACFAFAAISQSLLAADPQVSNEKKEEPKGKADPMALPTPTAEKPAKAAGELNDGDPIDGETNNPSKTYHIELKKGKLYKIDLPSADFDAFVRVLDAKGKELAKDDDSGGGTDAKLMFAPPADGQYKIVATTLDDNGKFDLTISVAKDLGRQVEFDANKIHEVGKGFFVANKITEKDPNDVVKDKSPCQVTQVKLEKGKTYIVELISSDFDSFLRIEDAAKTQLAEDDDDGGGLNSLIEFSPQETGVFRLLAMSLEGEIGQYTLTIREK